MESNSGPAPSAAGSSTSITGLRSLSPVQWRAGAAAWLGLGFDGMEAYLYILVAAPFVAELVHARPGIDPRVGQFGAYIQAAFLVGWAAGGTVFGQIGDRLGRSRTLSLTILTYALCTGLSALAQTWWQLLILRFVAAMGIGGEWAAGAALIAETWPLRWRAWTSPILMSAYECGMLLATLAAYLLPESPRGVFLVGVLPGLLVFWIRRTLPEPAEWATARSALRQPQPSFLDLFRGPILRTTLLTVTLCSMALAITWMNQFWGPQYFRSLPDLKSWSPADKGRYVSLAVTLHILAAIPGNFFAAGLAHRFGYRKAVACMFLGGLVSTTVAYGIPRDHLNLLVWSPWTSFFTGGIFGLFPLYLPPLFPTLLRTTGAGFCYNIGRVAAAIGTVVFGLYAPVGEYRAALVVVGALCIPTMLVALFIPDPPLE